KDFTETLKLLRNTDFQNLLENYERAEKVFLVSYEEHDEVSSTTIDRFGQFSRPEEYLEAFAEFIRKNESEIEAVSILLKRPQNWQPQALSDLGRRLREN